MFISLLWEGYKAQDISKLCFTEPGIPKSECFLRLPVLHTGQFPAVPWLMVAGPSALYKEQAGSETSAGVVLGGIKVPN